MSEHDPTHEENRLYGNICIFSIVIIIMIILFLYLVTRGV